MSVVEGVVCSKYLINLLDLAKGSRLKLALSNLNYSLCPKFLDIFQENLNINEIISKKCNS